MSDERTFLDTNAVLYFLGGQLAVPLPTGSHFMSVISEIELFSYPSLSSQEEEDIRKFLSKIEIVGLNTEIKETAIIFRRTHRLKTPDAIIAASAKCLHAILLTNDSLLLACSDIHTAPLQLRKDPGAFASSWHL